MLTLQMVILASGCLRWLAANIEKRTGRLIVAEPAKKLLG
jgi:hypothetical protein